MAIQRISTSGQNPLKSSVVYPASVTWQPVPHPIVEKPPFDSTAIKHWIRLGNEKVAITNDGNFFKYQITNYPYGRNTLVIQSVSGSWKKELLDVEDGFFSEDNKQFVYLDNDTLFFLTLGTNERQVIFNVNTYQRPRDGNGRWIFYQIKNAANELIIYNLSTHKEIRVPGVVDYKFDNEATMVLAKKNGPLYSQQTTSLVWVDLNEMRVSNSWPLGQGKQIITYAFDPAHKQVTWLMVDTSIVIAKPEYSIWYYNLSLDSPRMVVDNDTQGIDTGLTLSPSSYPGFTRDGRYLSFRLQEKELNVAKLDAVQVDVWNYQDAMIQSLQLLKKANREIDFFQAVVSISSIKASATKKVIRLLQKDEDAGTTDVWDCSGDFFLAREHRGGDDRFWERKYIYWLVSMNDGSRRRIYESKWNAQFWFSPNGRYLLQFKNDHKYYSYDLQTGKSRNISGLSSHSFNWESPYYKGDNSTAAAGLVGWVGCDKSALVFDNYDIWQLDLSGQRSPLNITNGYGRLHNLKIELVDENRVYNPGDSILLSIFNPVNKFNGLFNLVLGSAQPFERPAMGPWSIYYSTRISDPFNPLLRPVKAKDANRWIVRRESATEAPNYFLTHDFEFFEPLTTIQPEKAYNWLTAELWHWKQTDGTVGQGVLYKPENFDSRKKYPLIISFYEQSTPQLYQYPTPEFIRATHFEISWFVSHGYLVFAPDMVYTKGKMVESVCNTLISAGQRLALIPYINGKKMGIGSYSWGGVQTNWLVSQTNIFAAVATGGGSMGADPVSTAFQVRESRGVKDEPMDEYVEDLLGGSLWENPARWLNISPVLRANKVTSPLLMLHNYGEFAWQQDVEFFMALRRLDKKVWLLQYDHGRHGLGGKDAEDFTIRITQFFDHYLKGAPAPKWMIEGIPAKMKGIDDGLELDYSGKQP